MAQGLYWWQKSLDDIMNKSWGRKTLLQQLPQGGIVAEIGVWRGEYAERIVGVCRPDVLHLIDPWISSPLETEDMTAENAFLETYLKFGKIMADTDIQVAVHRHKSADVVNTFPNEYFTWIYIDGDHSYEGVESDLRLYLPKMKGDGIITGDDYCKVYPGVIQAVNEFVEQHEFKLELLSSQFIIRLENKNDTKRNCKVD